MSEKNLESQLEGLFSDADVPGPQPEPSPEAPQPQEPRVGSPETSSVTMPRDTVPDTAVEIASELRAWRVNALNTLLTVVAITSLPILVVVIIQAMRNPEQWTAVLAFLTIYGLLVGLTVFRRLDFRLRVWVVLLIGWVVGVMDVARGGLAGNGGMYFLVLSALAVILIDLRSGLIMAVLSLLAFAGLAAAAQLGWLANWLIYTDNPLTLESWIAAGTVLVMLLVALLGMQWLFNRFLLNTLQEARQTAAGLSQTHDMLRRQTEELERANRLLEKRARALDAAAKISRAASSMLQTEALIHQTVNLIRDRFGYYYVGLFLVDASARWAVLNAGTGEAGRQMLAQGYKLQVGGDSMIGWCTAHGQARIALDVGQEAIRFDDPLLPETRSEMALPLISRGQVIGALTVQSAQAQAFSDEDTAVLQTMADQVANAIENARLLQETERLARRSQLVTEVSDKLRGALDLEEVLQTTVRELGLALGASEAVIRLGPPTLLTQTNGDGAAEQEEVIA